MDSFDTYGNFYTSKRDTYDLIGPLVSLSSVRINSNEPYHVLSSISSSDGYAYGFNGQMKVNEWAGSGNHTTALFWEYDSRTGRRGNIDPMYKKFPDLSPYATNNNNPILLNDPNGDCPVCALVGGLIGGFGNLTGQMISNKLQGKGLLEKIDWFDVGITAFEGALAGGSLGLSEAIGKPSFAIARAGVDINSDGIKVAGGPEGYHKNRDEVIKDAISEVVSFGLGKLVDGGGVGKSWKESGILKGETKWKNINKFVYKKIPGDAMGVLFGGFYDSVVKAKANFEDYNTKEEKREKQAKVKAEEATMYQFGEKPR